MSCFDAHTKRVGFILLLTYAITLAWFSLAPGSDSTPYFPHDDKVMHFCAYAVFSLLCMPFINTRFMVFFCAISIFIFGALMEVGQSFVPMRHTSFLDILANTLGMLAGIYWAKKLRLKPVFQKML